MRMHQVKCPACGASVEVEKGREFCFCSYCGTKIYVNDGVHRVEITEKINYHKTYTDEARIRKAESEERMHEREYADKRAERKHKEWSALGTVLIGLAFVIGLITCWGLAKTASDCQEQELQTIVEDVLQDIEEGNFEEAYIKAEKIRYTVNWSSEIEDKWDATRKEVIKQVKKAEKETSKDEDGDTWWNPFD